MPHIRKFWHECRFPIIVFFLWRSASFALGFLGFHLLPFKASFPFIREVLTNRGFPQWLWQWANFDGVHYLVIARFGYSGAVNGEQTFFPLYPLLIRIGFLTFQSRLLAALFISNIFALLMGILFFKLCKKHFSEGVAKWSVIFLYAFPTAFFFGSVYTESLFLTLIVASFYFQGKFVIIFAFLSGLTRLVGIVLSAAAMFKPRKLLLLGSVLGLVCYMTYLGITFGEPMKFLSAQGSFKNERATSLTKIISPPQVLYRYLKIFTTAQMGRDNYDLAILEFGAFAGVGLIMTVLTVRREVPLPWLIFAWGCLILPSLSGTLSSMPRYVLACFPIYIYFARLKSKYLKFLIITAMLIFQGLLTIYFLRGYFVA